MHNEHKNYNNEIRLSTCSAPNIERLAHDLSGKEEVNEYKENPDASSIWDRFCPELTFHAVSSAIACILILLIAAFLNFIISRLEQSRKQEQKLIFNELQQSHAVVRGEKNKITALRKDIDTLRQRFQKQADAIHLQQIERYKLLMLRKKRVKQAMRIGILTQKLKATLPQGTERQQSILSRKSCRYQKQVRWLRICGFGGASLLFFGTGLFSRHGV